MSYLDQAIAVNELADYRRRLEALEPKIDQLRAERDEALALLRDITDDVSPWDVTYGLQGSCQICGGDRHDDDCPWVAARNLFAECLACDGKGMDPEWGVCSCDDCGGTGLLEADR